MKYLKILMISIFIIPLSGCVSYMELNEIGIIDMILIDKQEESYIVTINMITPTKDDLENKSTYSTKSPSLDECLAKLYLSSNKKIAFSHLELMAFTPNIMKEDYDEIMNLFLNRVDSRNTFSTIIVENSQNLFQYRSEDINDLINMNHEEYGTVSIKQFDSIIKDILEYHISYVPKIKIEEEPTIVGYQSIYEENKDLSLKESIGYNFILNKISQARLNTQDIGFKLDTSNTNIDIQENKIKINITSSYQIISNNSDIDNEKEIKKKYEEIIREDIEEFIKNNRHNYFYHLIEKYDYQYYQEHKNATLEFDIHIDSTKIDNSNIKGGDYFE